MTLGMKMVSNTSVAEEIERTSGQPRQISTAISKGVHDV
jgi:hypothetical protein